MIGGHSYSNEELPEVGTCWLWAAGRQPVQQGQEKTTLYAPGAAWPHRMTHGGMTFVPRDYQEVTALYPHAVSRWLTC